MKVCQCASEVPATNHIDKCGKGKFKKQPIFIKRIFFQCKYFRHEKNVLKIISGTEQLISDFIAHANECSKMIQYFNFATIDANFLVLKSTALCCSHPCKLF